ncbi:MAG: hypothetical protein U0941_06050 [Planctomycetaceae bacterium]
MGRIIGLIGCMCLVIVTLRFTNLQYTDHTLKGGEDRVHAGGRQSPREHYKSGRELYLRGKYKDAVDHLQAATAAGTGLTGTERRQADEFLAKARNRMQLGKTGATVRAQSWDEDAEAAPEAPTAGGMPPQMQEANRNRIENWMNQSIAAMKRGDRAEAIRLATQAHNFAKTAEMKFEKGEVTPAVLLAQLKGQQPAASPSAAVPDWANDDVSVGNVAKANPSRKVQQIAGEESESDNAPVRQATSSGQPSTPRDRAIALVAEARKDLMEGRYDEARRKALAADELDVTFNLFEDRPELLLTDIDRVANTRTFAAKPKSAPTAADMAGPSQTNVAKTAGGTDSRKQQAIRLLEQARQDLANGNLDGAQAKAEQAAQLNVAYKLFEDMPELVLSEVAANRAAANVAESKPAQQEAPNVEASAKPQALALLAKARQALQEQRLEEAKQLAIEAEKLKAPFDLFDDRPDLVLAEVARSAKRGPTAIGNPVDQSAARNTSPAGQPANVNTAAARQNLSPAQAQAIDLLRQARQLAKAGRFDEAKAKAEEAELMNVTFPVFADRPDLVLADLAAAQNGNVASRTPAGTNVESVSANEAPVDPEVNPFAPNAGRRPAGRDYGSVTQADSTDAISNVAPNPNGVSASELYNRGMMQLNRGNRQAAYSAFLAAHQTGQKLDYVRAQRLQDYLRELAPRTSKSGIQLTNNQVTDNDVAMIPGEDSPAPLDAAQQEQMVRFDRIRGEVLNAVFKAERMRAKDPEAALALIDQTMAKVEGAELAEEAAASLMRQLTRTRSSLQGEIVRQQPNLDLKKRNEETKSILEKDLNNRIRIEQEFAKMVDEFNDLMNQKRFAEAEVVAKKAIALNPKDPVAVTMFHKSRIGRHVDSNETLKIDKEESYWKQLDDVEQGVIVNVTDDKPLDFGKSWKDITKRRDGKYRPDNRKRGPEELRIEQSLTKRISLHEDQVPLAEVIKKIQAIADINIVLDAQGLEDEAAHSNSLVSIDVDNISVKSALNLVLGRYNLSYMIGDEVLKITSRMRQQGELIVATYSVADLVVPVPDPSNQLVDPFSSTNPVGFGGGQMSVPPGQGFGQVAQNQNDVFDPANPSRKRNGNNRLDPDFSALSDLIVSTIAPDSWDQVGGPASIRSHETTLSLVIRQTQKIHEEITDLLDQLRRLQDLQVTIEVRFVTVSDRFFERIGIDFNFNIAPTTGLPQVDNTGLPLGSFGSVNLPQFGLSGTQQNQQGQNQQNQQGQNQQQQGQQNAAGGKFGAGPSLNLYNNPSNPSIVGMRDSENFTRDLTVPFQQGSFSVGVPTFGSYNPRAGMEMGLAILSDIEAFFFIQAAQGDQRNNLMFAPKVTVFNGQTGTVADTKRRPFVTSLVPTVGFNSTGFQPVITTINEGITLSVTAVVSSDRRFVRLSVNPQFNSITDVFTFSFVGGGGQQGQQQQGQQQQGGQGGFGGGQFGGGGGGGQQFGGQQFGIGGNNQNGGNQNGGNQNGNQNGNGGGGGQTITVQQPVVEQVTVLTTVSVPDGGTILLGGIKRLKEGRNMSGVPILNKLPYVSRLFKNTGVGRETESLMLMITPRIIIQEEEEELLGLPRT